MLVVEECYGKETASWKVLMGIDEAIGKRGKTVERRPGKGSDHWDGDRIWSAEAQDIIC